MCNINIMCMSSCTLDGDSCVDYPYQTVNSSIELCIMTAIKVFSKVHNTKTSHN